LSQCTHGSRQIAKGDEFGGVIRAARSQIMAINARMAELDGVKRRLALLASLKECRGASI